MKIIPLQVGTVRIKKRQVRGVGHGPVRNLATMLDVHWTDDLPILAWAIDHPEGIILVDTGETIRAMEKGWYPAWHPSYRYGIRTSVKPEETIAARLAQHGIAEQDIRTIVFTHLHTDHVGGMCDLTDLRADLWAHEKEWEESHGIAGKVRGYLPNRYPLAFLVKPYVFTDGACGPFSASQWLTKSGDVCVVETPGHTAGHCSVIVTDGDTRYVIAGDTSYNEQNMRDDAIDGVLTDETSAHETLEMIERFCQSANVVYLPTHDPDSVARLEARRLT